MPGPEFKFGPGFFELSISAVLPACRLVLVELQTKFQLLNRLIGGLDGFHAVATEVMRGVFHVCFRAAQGFERFADFRMLFRRSGGHSAVPAPFRRSSLFPGCRRPPYKPKNNHKPRSIQPTYDH